MLNLTATQRMVNALGGVDVRVEHPMDYDDNWGHLHIHLRPGLQHLNGNQAVQFIRYRHANPPNESWFSSMIARLHSIHPSKDPEDGDRRRVYRQQVLLRAMVTKAKSVQSLLQANGLIDTAMSCVRTDLTRTQIFDLALLFRDMTQTQLVSSQLPTVPYRTPDGKEALKMTDQNRHLYVEWFLDTAGNIASSSPRKKTSYDLSTAPSTVGRGVNHQNNNDQRAVGNTM